MNLRLLFLNKAKVFTYAFRLQTPQASYCYNNENLNLRPYALCIENRASFQTSSIKDDMLKKFKKKIYNSLSENSKIKFSASLAYERVVDKTDWNDFMNYFKLPDTLFSWFLAVQLHVWMCILVTASEKQGKFFRNILVDAMWNDVEERIKQLTAVESSKKKKYLSDMFSQFQAAIISYDEGISGDDKDLAASAWRTLYSFEEFDPRLLEDIVLYIRKEVSHLESLNKEDILFYGVISLIPLKTILQETNKESP